MNTPRKNDFGTFTLGVHGNAFFVPKKNRSFIISQSDFSFFTLNEDFPVEVPTVIGGGVEYNIEGNLGGLPISLSLPNGIEKEQVIYPFVQGSLAIWGGFEIIARYTSKVKFNKGDYQIYGFGLKHNFSQYIPYLDKNKFNLAALVSNSIEEVNYTFFESNIPFINNIGVGKIRGNFNIWQFQISGSKVWNRFELIASTITNVSTAKYFLTSNESVLRQLIPLQSILNNELRKQYKTAFNSISELSGRYQINNFYLQSSFAFGKFVNLNFGIDYQF